MEGEKKGPWKLSTNPQEPAASMFKALKALKLAIHDPQFSKDKLVGAFQHQGLDADTFANLFGSLEDSLVAWTKTLQEKVQQQAETIVEEMDKLQLPEYKADVESEVKKVLGAKCVEDASKLVSKVKAFLDAVEKCCGCLAGIETDTKKVQDSLMSGRKFVYVFTILSVLESPVWKSVCKETVSKKESRQANIAKDLQFALTGVKTNGVNLPDDLLQRCADQLAKAGQTPPE